MPDSRQNGQSLYPFSDQKWRKTILFGAAHTYMAYIREYRLPRITVGPSGLVLSNSKGDKVTPLFFIKTINKACRVASQEMRCSSD